MYEECNGAEKYYFYDSNGIISGIRYYDANGNMTMIYVVTNSQGDVIALYDRSGNAVVEYQYDAWGNIISTTNTTEGSSLDWNEVNPFRYRGYYYDADTGLYYLQSRYYDAETGRFINQDSYISTGTGLLGYNMFAYCDNNPVNGWDPTGERTFECCPYGDCASCKAKKKTVYIRRTSSGKDVYITKDSKHEVPQGSVKIVDRRDTNVTDNKHNPDMKIINSYKIKDANEQKEVLAILDQYNKNYPSKYEWKRTTESLLVEWDAHNDIYFLSKHERVQHVDFDVFDEDITYVGYWIRAIQEGFDEVF